MLAKGFGGTECSSSVAASMIVVKLPDVDAAVTDASGGAEGASSPAPHAGSVGAVQNRSSGLPQPCER